MPRRTVDVWTSLLMLWITFLSCASATPIATATAAAGPQSDGAPTAGSAAASGPGEGQRLLSRAKRGWVWNQMFVLEEFSGPDPILVGRVSGVIVSVLLSSLIVRKH